MAGRSGGNVRAANKAFKEFEKEMDDALYKALDTWCVAILREAVSARFSTEGAHNFTGNLVNSICVLLYRKSTGTKTEYYAYDKAGIKLPVRREFSGMTARGTHRKNRVWLRPDYNGGESALKGSNLIRTDESWGQNDAREFAKWWTPKNPNKDFVICVAYTSEYASFVENERNTTGILQTEAFIQTTAVEFMGLKAA